MFRFVRNPDPRKKPPYGSRIDPTHPLAQGLVGCWLFNEGGGRIAYDLANNINGLFSGGVSWEIDIGNYVLEFNSSSSVNVGNSEILRPQEITVTIKWKLNSAMTNASGAMPVFWQDNVYDTNKGYNLKYHGGTDAIYWQVGNGSTRGSVNHATGTNYGWYTSVCIYCNSDVKSYLKTPNGSLLSEFTTLSGPISYDITKNVYFGGYFDNQFESMIEYGLVYNRALSTSEVKHLFAEPYSFILVPQYWYMVDFGVVEGSETITLAAMSLQYTGRSLFTNETFNLQPLSLSFTGKNLSINEILTLVRNSLSFSGKNLLLNEAVSLNRGTLAFTGKTLFFNETVKLAKQALSWAGAELAVIQGYIVKLTAGTLSWTGKNLYLNEVYSLIKGVITFTGKALTALTGETVTLVKGTLSWTGKAIKINEAVNLAKGTLKFTGKILKGLGGVIRSELSIWLKIK